MTSGVFLFEAPKKNRTLHRTKQSRRLVPFIYFIYYGLVADVYIVYIYIVIDPMMLMFYTQIECNIIGPVGINQS